MPRGRRPAPTAVKRLRGNPGKRKLNAREPKPPKGAPEMPEWMSRRAKEEWFRVVPMLLKMQVLTKVDGPALAAYCECYATWRRAQEIIGTAETLTFTTEKGFSGPIAEISIANKCMTQMRQFLGEFGMTPAARTKLSTEAPDEKEDPLAKYLGPRSA